MSWLGAVPAWCWWLIALVLVVGGQQYRVVVAQDETAEARTELSDYRLQVSERDRRAAAQARTEEHRIADAQQEARVKVHEDRTIADAGAAGADAAGQRLRDDGAKFAAAISCPGPDTGAIARGKAATRAAMVLSDLLARADARAGELAKAYDRARIAGLACEASYNALIN
ncbi:DUF2514 domain-containing protein [Pseudomonas putida]|uniref:DUF2514 domain-containing protein n=1 Tax=Pseudomonas putida TaxID=303 RepID=UPI00034EE89D|nr:DUF2514 domain-containing protein [Pseudomonas putida]AGN83332.1 hypothetical protein L483_28285 [Pseudomonas putida H8234]HDS1814303.1 DUF2514 domain-containing protein [Pseudomonas putida]HDS3810821.1 DUF2514 domain-containing protein [Pseudomonas putida]